MFPFPSLSHLPKYSKLWLVQTRSIIEWLSISVCQSDIKQRKSISFVRLSQQKLSGGIRHHHRVSKYPISFISIVCKDGIGLTLIYEIVFDSYFKQSSQKKCPLRIILYCWQMATACMVVFHFNDLQRY